MEISDEQLDGLNTLWDKLAAGVFVQPEIRRVNVGRSVFQSLCLPRSQDIGPKMYIESGLATLLSPRLAGYRYRWVLIPRDTIGSLPRWEVSSEDIKEWIVWANCANHVVTFSTYKSGGGVPNRLHAQSVPFCLDRCTNATALPEVVTEPAVSFRTMPFFGEVSISVIQNYVAQGIQLTGSLHPDALDQLAQKTYEIALNYDHLKTFNLVIVPTNNESGCVYFFPRRRDGRCIFGNNRWQIGAMELCGLLPAKTQGEFAAMDEASIKAMFATTCPDKDEFHQFIRLIQTY